MNHWYSIKVNCLMGSNIGSHWPDTPFLDFDLSTAAPEGCANSNRCRHWHWGTHTHTFIISHTWERWTYIDIFSSIKGLRWGWLMKVQSSEAWSMGHEVNKTRGSFDFPLKCPPPYVSPFRPNPSSFGVTNCKIATPTHWNQVNLPEIDFILNMKEKVYSFYLLPLIIVDVFVR